MLRLKIVLFAGCFSIAIHIIFLFGFKPYVNAKLTPYFFIWPDILDKNYAPAKKTINIDSIRKNAIFMQGMDFNKSFFFSSLEKPEVALKHRHTEKVSHFLDNFQNESYKREAPGPLYLWKKSENLPIQEKVSYKALVSPYGKVIFSFPEKLTINSSDDISSQEYMRQASIFFRDKFFWTKLEAVVR
ncbi:MAG: hypothetical protein WCY05_02695 [Candidatus Omnitrophota bacterium]